MGEEREKRVHERGEGEGLERGGVKVNEKAAIDVIFLLSLFSLRLKGRKKQSNGIVE